MTTEWCAPYLTKIGPETRLNSRFPEISPLGGIRERVWGHRT